MASDVSTTASASGARITGDDIQYAVAWHAALQTLVPNAGVDGVIVEAAVPGNIDDVVIQKRYVPDEYTQVKAAVSAAAPATIAWLTEVNRKRGSILQRFHSSWRELTKDGQRPQLNLVTNRSIDPSDPILTLRDRYDRLASRVRDSTKPATVSAVAELRSHLQVGEDELFDFLSHVRLGTDASDAAWRERVREISFAAGVKADEAAFRLGISEVREWVKSDRTPRHAEDIAKAVERLAISAEQPFAIVSINALEAPVPISGASIELDWVDRFRGTEARNRRGLKNTEDWPVLREELMTAQRTLRANGARRVLLTGTMRLPTWFAAGVAFQETAGFTVAKMKGSELWTKPKDLPPPARIDVSHTISELRVGSDIALAIAIADDPTQDVRRHMALVHPDVPVVTVSPASGVSGASISGLQHGFALAIAVRDLVRDIARVARPPILHLFMACPAGFAVLLGGVWDRVPSTQTYEDLGAYGYEPAFFIPN